MRRIRLEAQQKEEVLELFDQARAVGMTEEKLATLLGLERHRLNRWRTQKMTVLFRTAFLVHDKCLTVEDIHMLRSFTRPSTPTDNPFIKSFFSTLKGHPTYPGRFESFEAAQSYCLNFFPWYNRRHPHSAIGFVTPADKHFGKASTILELRIQKSRWARQRRLSTNRSEQFKLKLDT